MNKVGAALLLALVSVLASACSRLPGWGGTLDTRVRPHPDAPVTVVSAESDFTISNNTDDAIYHVVFPVEILPRIEWAPCWQPDRCDPGLKIASGEQKVYRFDSVAGEDTQKLVVYWWRLLKNSEGGYDPPQIEEVRIPVQ